MWLFHFSEIGIALATYKGFRGKCAIHFKLLEKSFIECVQRGKVNSKTHKKRVKYNEKITGSLTDIISEQHTEPNLLFIVFFLSSNFSLFEWYNN